jgi:acyl carrier protein
MKALAKKYGITLNKKDLDEIKKGRKKPKPIPSNAEIKEILKNQKDGLTREELEAFLRGENLGLTEDEV